MHEVHIIVVHKLVYFIFLVSLQPNLRSFINMKKSFVYGMFVEGDNFTDREKETHRLKMDFEHGLNVLTNKELIERRTDGIYIAAPVLEKWLLM